MRPLLTFGVALGLAWCARPAQAQERAEALFERGVSAFLAGRFEEGCPLIEKSHALDPLPGVLFTLAECQFGWGKAKTAADNYGRFLDVVGRLPPAEAGKHAERAAVAIRKRAQAAQRIASVTLRVQGQWVPGTRVTLGSKDVTLLVGKRIELDPGSVSVALVQPGRPVVRREVALRASQDETVELAIEPPPPPEPAAEPAASAAAPSPSPTSSKAGAWVLGGVGLLGVAVGGVTGAMAWSKRSTIEDNCPNRVCNSSGRSAVDSGQELATVSTISFGVGLVALGGATYLFLKNDERASASTHRGPRVALGLGSAMLSGSF